MSELLVENRPFEIEGFGPIPNNEFAGVAKFLESDYLAIINDPNPTILNAEDITRQTRENSSWYALRTLDDDFPKGLEIFSGFIQLPSGELIKVPPEARLQAAQKLSEVLGGLSPVPSYLSGILKYEPYLRAISRRENPEAKFSRHDQKPDDHGVGAWGMVPHLTSKVVSRAKYILPRAEMAKYHKEKFNQLRANERHIDVALATAVQEGSAHIESAQALCLTTDGTTMRLTTGYLEAVKTGEDFNLAPLDTYLDKLDITDVDRAIILHQAQLTTDYMRDPEKDLRDLPKAHEHVAKLTKKVASSQGFSLFW